MSRLSDALAASRDAFVAMGDAPAFSGERLRAIADFYRSNLGIGRALKGLTVDEAKATYEDLFGGASPESFDDVAAGGSSTAPEHQTYENSTDTRPRRRRRRHRETITDEDIFDVLNVR